MKHMADGEPAITEVGPTGKKKHWFFDKWPLVYLLVLPTFFIIYGCGAAIGQGLLSFIPYSDNALVLIFSLLYLGLYLLRFKGELSGIVDWSTTGLILLIPALSFGAYNLINSLIDGSQLVDSPLTALLAACVPGVAEEVIFRAVPVSNAMRIKGTAVNIIPNVLISAAVFGLMHAINLTAGAEFGTTMFQVFYAFCLSTVFAAAFMRTGSILPCMIVHTLIDFTSFTFVSEESVFQFDIYAVIVVIICAAMLLWALYLVRPSKHEEIVAVWDKKCHRDQVRDEVVEPAV